MKVEPPENFKEAFHMLCVRLFFCLRATRGSKHRNLIFGWLKLFSGHVVVGDTLVLLIVADFMDISELFLLYAQHFVFSLSHNFLLVILL